MNLGSYLKYIQEDMPSAPPTQTTPKPRKKFFKKMNLARGAILGTAALAGTLAVGSTHHENIKRQLNQIQEEESKTSTWKDKAKTVGKYALGTAAAVGTAAALYKNHDDIEKVKAGIKHKDSIENHKDEFIEPNNKPMNV